MNLDINCMVEVSFEINQISQAKICTWAILKREYKLLSEKLVGIIQNLLRLACPRNFSIFNAPNHCYILTSTRLLHQCLFIITHHTLWTTPAFPILSPTS